MLVSKRHLIYDLHGLGRGAPSVYRYSGWIWLVTAQAGSQAGSTCTKGILGHAGLMKEAYFSIAHLCCIAVASSYWLGSET